MNIVEIYLFEEEIVINGILEIKKRRVIIKINEE